VHHHSVRDVGEFVGVGEDVEEHLSVKKEERSKKEEKKCHCIEEAKHVE
jgi:hypothetical protein